MTEMETNLLKVIDALRLVPDKQFNIEHWWLDDGWAFDDERNRRYKVANGPCGCTIGHLIQRGLLSGDVIKPHPMPEGSLPYEYRDRIFVQISDALKLYNYKIAEFLFDQYAYFSPRNKITRHDVIKRIKFIISEARK